MTFQKTWCQNYLRPFLIYTACKFLQKIGWTQPLDFLAIPLVKCFMLYFCENLKIGHEFCLAFRALRNVRVFGLFPASHELFFPDQIVTSCVLTADLCVNVNIIKDQRDCLWIVLISGVQLLVNNVSISVVCVVGQSLKIGTHCYLVCLYFAATHVFEQDSCFFRKFYFAASFEQFSVNVLSFF